jgi:hypothetical protein
VLHIRAFLAEVALQDWPVCTPRPVSCIGTGTIPRFPRDLFGTGQLRGEVQMPGRQIKPQPESVMADVCLGVTVTGIYTLVGMGLIIAFM